MSKVFILNQLEKRKGYLQKTYGIRRIGLFGSHVKGNARADSDIDLLYELEHKKRLGLRELTALETDLRNCLGVERVDLVDIRFLNPVLAIDIESSVAYV